jgi:hypothetical protein|tara:strand:+ start:251 stop:373 length:123 start_codon:yes stop_codon:yes gene_type:complete
MKIKVAVELDTTDEKDLNILEEVIQALTDLADLAENQQDE